MASKLFYHNIDLDKVGQLQNARVQNLSDSEIATLSSSLSNANIGLVVYNTTTKSLATWNGTGFDAYQIDVVGDIKFAGPINPTNSATITPVPGAQYIVDTTGTLDTQGGTVSYSPSASVEVGDSVIFTTATTAFVVQRNLQQATDSTLGTVRLATQAEVDAGNDATEAVTPATLHGYVNPIAAALQSQADATALDVDALETRATAIETDVTALETSATALDTRVGAAETSITALQAADVSLQSAIGSLQTNTTSAIQTAVAAEAGARQAADAALQASLNTIVAKRYEKRVIQSSDISVYADSSVAPMIDPNGQSGWYFKNAATGQKINWYPYINTKNAVDPTRPAGVDTATYGGIVSIWAVVKIYTPTSRPYITIYSAPTGTGDAAAWYKSRWVHELSVAPVTPTTPGTYLMHFGTDPGVHQHLPRLVMPNVNTNARGTVSPTETLLMYAWGTNSAAAVNSQSFTIEESGHNFAGRETAYSYVHTGASQADVTTAVTAEATARTAAVSAVASRATALEARDEVFTKVSTVNLVAGTPLTVNHALGLANKDSFVINTMYNGAQISLSVVSVDANNITLESAVSLNGAVVSIIGF
jgi:hypothetical protein